MLNLVPEGKQVGELDGALFWFSSSTVSHFSDGRKSKGENIE